MAVNAGSTSGLFTEYPRPYEFTADRIRWLISMRWVAMVGVAIAAMFSAAGIFPGVAWPLLVLVAVGGTVYNFLLWRNPSSPKRGRQAAVFQAMVDMFMLTVVLWAAGGISSPFIGYYIFHVALIAVLGGPRAMAIAFAGALVGVGFLGLAELVPSLKVGRWAPEYPWDMAADIVAFVTTLAAAAYVVTHAARELRQRERELTVARDRAELEYQVISNTLDELEAGLEVVDAKGTVEWRNRLAERLAPPLDDSGAWQCARSARGCETEAAGDCPVTRAWTDGSAGRCRFNVDGVDGERIYEMLSFPLASRDGEQPRVMNLYLDRTHLHQAERRLLVAERLASLGRVAQGVAHELNTPLATIRTLAADMREVLHGLPQDDHVRDIGESATLIRDETARLGRITQSLLAGGELPRVRIQDVALRSVVERASALVFAGTREGTILQIGESVSELYVRADPDRLVQVMVNLLQNAHDAIREAGGKQITVYGSQTDGIAKLVVEDDGTGIPASIEGRLFEPFSTTKPPGEGTGLGLYASYMLVRTMGGDLNLENREQRGARATLRLPAVQRHLAKGADVQHRGSWS